MNAAIDVIKKCYAAYQRGDVGGMLEWVSDEVDWECIAPAGLAYAGRRSDRAGVARFFADLVATDEVKVFEPREFIDAGDTVVVLGFEQAIVRDTGHRFESMWAQVFTVHNERIVRWRGWFDTAARIAN